MLSLAGLTSAQTIETPPVRSAVDGNGVNVINGSFNPTTIDLTIGQPGSGGLTYGRTFLGGLLYPGSTNWQSTLDGTATIATGAVTVSVGFSTETFTQSGTVYYSSQGTGDTVAITGTGPYTVTMTGRDGTSYAFLPIPGPTGNALLSTITHPAGEIDSFHYNTGSFTSFGTTFAVTRLQSVTNNLGYQIQIQYAANTLNSDGSNYQSWLNRTVVTGINNAIEYCSPTANSCSLTHAWPTATYGVPSGRLGATVTDALNNTTTYYFDPTISVNGRISTVQKASGSTVGFSYGSGGQISSVSNGIGNWTYGYSAAGSALTVTITDPNSHVQTVVADLTQGVITSSTDALNRTTTFAHDGLGRLTGVTYPEGNGTTITYDSPALVTTRGNVTTVTRNPKPGSGLSATSTSASYDTSCGNPVKCNEPNSTTDARSNTTNYTYDPTYGVLLTISPPPPTTGAVQPQTRYSYTPSFAYYKNSSGSIVPGASSVDVLTGVSACQTQAAATCPGTSDEVKTTVAYGSTGIANNLLPTSVNVGAGDGSLSATASQTYDIFGNVATTVGPLGTNQTTVSLYDADRRVIGQIGPNPGMSEGLDYPASRITYDADGLVTETERGSDTTQSDTNFSTFTSLQQLNTTYDSLNRPSLRNFTAGGTTFNVSPARLRLPSRSL